MEINYKIEFDSDVKLCQYDKLLSRFNNWSENWRDIKLYSLLESDKKIEFIVEMDFNSSVNLLSGASYTFGLFNLKFMRFIISSNKVESLELKMNISNSDLIDIISKGSEYRIDQVLDIDGNVREFNLICL